MVRIKQWYVLCEIETEDPKGLFSLDDKAVLREIWDNYMECFGEIGMAKARGNM